MKTIRDLHMELYGHPRKQDDEDEESPFPELVCSRCLSTVVPTADQTCPACGADLSTDLAVALAGDVEAEVESKCEKALTERDHTFAHRTMRRILHLQKTVAQLRRRLASMDGNLAKLDARKADLAAAVESVYAASRVQRPPDPLVAATAELRKIAARKKGLPHEHTE
jgi:hypothetical protein